MENNGYRIEKKDDTFIKPSTQIFKRIQDNNFIVI